MFCFLWSKLETIHFDRITQKRFLPSDAATKPCWSDYKHRQMSFSGVESIPRLMYLNYECWYIIIFVPAKFIYWNAFSHLLSYE